MPKTVTAAELAASIVSKVRAPAIPYKLGGRSDKGTDCINLIGWAMQELGGRDVSRGSNEAWRKDMAWRGTLAEAKRLGRLLPGAILYIDYQSPPGGSDGTPGKMDHAAVYVGPGHGIKTPDGKAGDVVHASASRGGVYPSTLANAYTHAAWLMGVDYGANQVAEPPKPANPTSPPPSSNAPDTETYTVAKGDTLWRIAASKLGSGARYTEIMALNGLASERIAIGQKLKIPEK